MELGMVEEFNRKHLASRASDPSLAARVKSFETAFGMQQQAPEVFDLSQGVRRHAQALRTGTRIHARASPGSVWSRAASPNAAFASSS